MYNLLSNAIKFTPERGKVRMTASLDVKSNLDPARGAKLAASDEYLRVAVSDTGIGIKAQDQDRIFIEFEQVDSSYARQQQGTGLGLALTKKLIEMHGGVIWVDSDGVEGRGSTFTFVIPMKHDATRAPAPRPLARDKSKTVVIIDDDPTILSLLAETLEIKGFEVLQADNARKGLELVSEHLPGCIILDLVMPETNGFQVIEQLRANPQTSEIPVFIYTGADISEEQRERWGDQVEAFVGKTEHLRLITEVERVEAFAMATRTGTN
jgi:CheY-like chemotaxis protein